MEITYFSWLRSEIGHSEERLNLPDHVKTLENLMDFLISKGSGYKRAFSNPSVVNVSINSKIVNDFSLQYLTDEDRVSFFSPMAGG